VNKEIKRRTNVVGIFPNEAGVLRLAGSILLEVHDEWQVTERRYLSESSMTKLYEIDNDGVSNKEVGAKNKELLAG
jgi:putative transposase